MFWSSSDDPGSYVRRTSRISCTLVRDMGPYTCWSSRKDEANEQPQSKPRGEGSAEAPQTRKVGSGEYVRGQATSNGWEQRKQAVKEFGQAQGAILMNDMNHIHED
jgi:hypothetical protein